jgi:hypothetical protein
MKRKRHTPEQIVRKLRMAEAELGTGTELAVVLKKLEVSEATFARWRREYGTMSPERMKTLKELEKENARLKRIVAEQQLDNEVLREAVRGKL